MKKFILLILMLQIGHSQIPDNNYKGPIADCGIGLSYFGSSVKTHWDIEFGWMFAGEDNFGIAVGLEGIFDSQTYDASVSSYNQQSAFINLKFLSYETTSFLSSISFGWLVKDDANIFHKGGNIDCFRIKISSQLNDNFSLFGAYYFDKDGSTKKRHDLPSIGISLGF